MAIWPSDHGRQIWPCRESLKRAIICSPSVLTRSLWCHPSRFYCQKQIFAYFTMWIYYMASECWMRAFQMSNRENKNCSELLLTNGMGLDGAPVKFLTLVFLNPPKFCEGQNWYKLFLFAYSHWQIWMEMAHFMSQIWQIYLWVTDISAISVTFSKSELTTTTTTIIVISIITINDLMKPPATGEHEGGEEHDRDAKHHGKVVPLTNVGMPANFS